MGIWGYRLYQNDTSSDVKDQFEDLFDKGKSAQEITEIMTNDFKEILDDKQEGRLFWYALADMQWKFGMLLPEVKEKALSLIDTDDCILDYQMTSSVKTEQRKKVLNDLKVKLLSPKPPMKKPKKKRVFKYIWKIGDIFAYRLKTDLAKEKVFLGRYFLIHIIDEYIYPPERKAPIAYVKITNDEKLPSNIDEYNKLEYVQTRALKYEYLFWPLNILFPNGNIDDIQEKLKTKQPVDEYGYLPHYRLVLFKTTKKIIQSELLFLGNYSNVIPPEKEFIPRIKYNIPYVYWKTSDNAFETKLINLYCGHNLRELSMYDDAKK